MQLLITLRESELATSFGLTLGDVFLRSIVMFCFAWLVLSFNLSWKNGWLANHSRNRMATDIAMNGGILILGLTTLTLLKQVFSSGFQEKKQFFFMALFSYLIVDFILVARLVNLNLQHQQNIIEKEQAKQNHKVEFNVEHLPDGAYIIRLNGEGGILTKPLIMSK